MSGVTMFKLHKAVPSGGEVTHLSIMIITWPNRIAAFVHIYDIMPEL
jgi:hypothetical protein